MNTANWTLHNKIHRIICEQTHVRVRIERESHNDTNYICVRMIDATVEYCSSDGDMIRIKDYPMGFTTIDCHIDTIAWINYDDDYVLIYL